MNRIFVPTDFSVCSINAFELALYLCEQNQAELVVAHGWNPAAQLITSDFVTPFQGVPGTMAPEQLSAFIEEHEQMVSKKLGELESKARERDIKCEVKVLKSSLFEDLAAYADESKCDLVVMGSHGSSGIHESLIGSNTQKFVRHSRIPVMVIKEKPESYKVYNVAFASTFSEEGEKEVFQRYKEIFKKQPIHTHFLFVNTPSNFYDTPTSKSRIQNFLKDTWPSEYSTHVYNDHSVEEGILNFCKRHEIDLLVMATHGYAGVRRVFHSSFTESIINHAKLPVISFRLSGADSSLE